MRWVVRQVVALVVAAVIVWVAWVMTPPMEFKDRLAARDPVGALESLKPSRLLSP